MDVMVLSDHAWSMTAALILLVLFLLLAVVGPVLGADSRRSRGWSAGEPDSPLWSDVDVAHVR
jgi:hypothetical protein